MVESLLSNKSEFNAYDAESTLLAQLLVPNNDPLCIPINEPVNEPVLICEELLTNPAGIPVSDDQSVEPTACVGAHEADTAKDAVVATLAVPNTEPLSIPVNDPLNEPVLICVELLTNPAGIPVSDDQSVEPIACVGAHEADTAKDAVVENEDVSAYDDELTVPFTNEAVVAKDDEITLFAQLEVPKVEPLCVPMNDPVNEPVLTANVIDVAADAVVANDEEIALLAQLLVPINVPVNDPLNEPVLI